MYRINRHCIIGVNRFFYIFRKRAEKIWTKIISVFLFYERTGSGILCRYGAAAGIMIMLTGCAHCPEQRISAVHVPVTVSCVQSIPQKPKWTMAQLTDSASDFDKIQALSVDFIAQQQYIHHLEAVVEGCK